MNFSTYPFIMTLNRTFIKPITSGFHMPGPRWDYINASQTHGSLALCHILNFESGAAPSNFKSVKIVWPYVF